jgi:Rps23 Pro-64 3,4-dihydroxylase Tpa1-like proline 4-hydroxylase
VLSNSFYTNLKTYKDSYLNENPFPHVVIDNFLKESVYQDLMVEIDEISKKTDSFFVNNAYGVVDEHDSQKGKRQIDGTKQMLPKMKEVIMFLNSKYFLSLVKEISGFKTLESTPDYSNSGYHQTSRGGFLDVHHDFNLSHHDNGLYRQINFLMYLNKDWDSSWGGDLELWNKDMSGPNKIIPPIGNRVVMFNIDKAPHGHPHPLKTPEGIHRKSFALYYYNREKPNYDLVKRAIWSNEITDLTN